jgi:hypothetical protein
MTLALARPSRIADDAPTFTALALFIALTAIPLLTASTLDTRAFADVPVWQKPLQFHLALSVFFITLAFFARFLPTPMTTRKWRIYTAIIAFAVIAELVWITTAATFGIASHFNRTQPVMMILYPVMGVFSIILSSPSLAMGVTIWRNKATGLPPALHLSVALGLMLTFLLTLIAAGTMSSGTGHLIGTPLTNARLPIVGWSREVGDLRVPHFIATHAMHIVPLAGFTQNRAIVVVSAVAYSALVAFTMWQAFQGQPFLPWLG